MPDAIPTHVDVIDSHTGGEPTRVVTAGGPPLGDGPLPERRRLFRERFDHVRSAVVNEPRGSDVLVGALLCAPTDAACAAGVIFFNNTGYLGMCGHGMMGVVVTLAHLGRIEPGTHAIETPVGVVHATLHDDHRVSVRNVPSYRHRADVQIRVKDYGHVIGDIAWGGNWFFLVTSHDERIHLDNVRRLMNVTHRIRWGLDHARLTGADGGEIDHIELFGPATVPGADGKNFVLCPGGAYDRSPCGTGTSAKLACLAADRVLAPGDVWRQEGIVGSVFEASFEPAENGAVIPTITGTAYVTGETRLLFHPHDPFQAGIRG